MREWFAFVDVHRDSNYLENWQIRMSTKFKKKRVKYDKEINMYWHSLEGSKKNN